MWGRCLAAIDWEWFEDGKVRVHEQTKGECLAQNRDNPIPPMPLPRTEYSVMFNGPDPSGTIGTRLEPADGPHPTSQSSLEDRAAIHAPSLVG